MSKPGTDKAAIRQIIREAKKNGLSVRKVANGDEDIAVSTENEAIEEVMSVDEAVLYFKNAEGANNGYIYFVLGNDPEEVACDYTVSLEPWLGPLTESWWDADE